MNKWKCPRCKREFAKKNQQHSCVSYPLANHFKNKEYAKELFNYLKQQIAKKIGPVKIESLPCCIHFVSSYTFGACWALRDRIRVDFRTDYKLTTKKPYKMIKISPNRFLYYIDLKTKKDIDAELLGWMRKLYGLHNK
jgi:hypothetical protein